MDYSRFFPVCEASIKNLAAAEEKLSIFSYAACAMRRRGEKKAPNRAEKLLRMRPATLANKKAAGKHCAFRLLVRQKGLEPPTY